MIVIVIELLFFALCGLLCVYAIAMHRCCLIFVIHGFEVEWIADSGERFADPGLLFE